MYSIFADDVCIFNDVTPLTECKVIDPKLTMEDNCAGSLEFTLPPGNAGYEFIERLNTDIIVTEDDVEIWRGRVINETEDFWKRRKYTCEGELAFLNDTIQPPHEYNVADTTIRSFLESMINIHNSKVGTNRQFTIGMVTVDDGDYQDDDDAIHRFTNYESTLQCINDKLVSKLKGHLRVRHQNGVRYLDYLKDYTGTNAQEVIFGSNLMDYTKNYDVSQLATVVVPRGNRLENSSIEGLEEYLTVASVNGGSIYVSNNTAVQNFGWIEVVVDWENVTDANTLLSKAQKYLQEEQFDEMTLEVSILDLHYLNPSITSLNILENVHCVSYSHGLDTLFPVTKVEIDLSTPGNTKYTLNSKVSQSLTSINNRINNEILERIANIPSKSSILKSAKDNALAILTGSEQGGYVNFVMGDGVTKPADQIVAIEITDGPTQATSLKRWLWDNGGLGYMYRDDISVVNPDGTPAWTDVGVAMTMDGAIVANFITSGNLKLAGNGSSAILQVYNGNNLIGQWDRNGITVVGGMLKNALNNPTCWIDLTNGTWSFTHEGRTTYLDSAGRLCAMRFIIGSGEGSGDRYIRFDTSNIYFHTNSGEHGSVSWSELYTLFNDDDHNSDSLKTLKGIDWHIDHLWEEVNKLKS